MHIVLIIFSACLTALAVYLILRDSKAPVIYRRYLEHRMDGSVWDYLYAVTDATINGKPYEKLIRHESVETTGVIYMRNGIGYIVPSIGIKAMYLEES